LRPGGGITEFQILRFLVLSGKVVAILQLLEFKIKDSKLETG
jgi:hypothetical protein